MNYTRLALAALAGTAVYFLVGGFVFAMTPLRKEFEQYPALYRPMETMKPLMPVGLVAMFIAILVVVTLFAMTSQRGLLAGTQFGALVGIFAVGGFVVHNYVNLNIGLRLTLLQAIAYFAEWIIVGLVIGLIYEPSTKSP